MKTTNPSRAALYVILTRGNHVSAMLLDRICYWAQYGKAKIKGVEGYWIANDRSWWMREAQLSPSQFDRSIANQDKFGLIERRQHPFGGRGNILHVRPTALTKDIIASARTWDVVVEILPQAGIPIPECLADHHQVTPSLAQMLEAFDVKEPTPEEVCKLAAYRENMKAMHDADYGIDVDQSKNTLPLIYWAKENWGKIGTKKAPQPSLAHFCDDLYPKALTEALKEAA
jgi:hypothetical protein